MGLLVKLQWSADVGRAPVWACPCSGEPGQQIPRDVVAVMTATEPGPNGPSVPPHWNVNLRSTTATLSRHAPQSSGAAS